MTPQATAGNVQAAPDHLPDHLPDHRLDQVLDRVARRALDTFAVLESVEDGEPSATIARDEWARWRGHVYAPARSAWVDAMTELRRLLGAGFPESEPRAWISVCVRILTGEYQPPGDGRRQR